MTRAGTEARTPALDAVFEPVHPPTTFEETVERLGTAIRLGLLPPKTKLPPERELADELGISRSTLRQAITTLVQSGHLVSRRGRAGGTFVADEPPLAHGDSGEPIHRDAARAVFDYRIAVETGAATLAAERATEDDFERLEAFTDSMSTTDGANFEEWRRADVRFHIGVAEACHSPRIVAVMTEVQGQMTDMVERIAHPDEVLTRANAQHRRLVTLLRRRDAVGAVRLIREHCAGTEHILAGLLPEQIRR
jgi:GntR family transcriptional regulator, transcriptional repressor for pyruvate dehydrogenase complex